MDKTQIVGKRQIEMLEGFVNKSKDLITDTLRVMVSGQKLTEEEQMIIKYSMIAYVISRAIPEAYYDRVIINIKKNVENNEGLLGCMQNKGNKFNVTFNTFEFSFNDDVSSLLHGLENFGHELRHAKQRIDAECGVIDVATLMISLEELLRLYSKGYYDEKYDSLFMEVEAVLSGSIYVKNYFEKYGTKSPFLDRLVLQMADAFKPKWVNYQDSDYIKNHVKEMLLIIANDPFIRSKVYSSGLNTLRQVMDSDGSIYPPEHFEKKLTNNNFDDDIDFYLFSRKAFYELLKEISMELQKKNIK